MGHVRLGRLPRTRRWMEVVDLIDCGASSAAVAAATLDAAERQFSIAANDPGVLRSFYLLTQIPDAARSGDFAAALKALGVDVGPSPTSAALSAALCRAIDQHVDANRSRTDMGEMAQLAALETVSSIIGARAAGLFGSSPADVQRETAKLATEAQFGTFAREFFARLTQRFLGHYVSQELPNHIGPGRRFANLHDQQAFSEALALHCRQASKIVESFAGGWYSKARFEKDLTENRTARVMNYAFTKLRRELQRGDLM